jgi:NitT/TauT family transport system ATP-binding protein
MPDRKDQTMSTPHSQLPILELREVAKSFGTADNAVRILDGITFDVSSGEFICVVGPSGSGKTTLLRCIAGLAAPTSGQTILEGQEITGPPRQIAVVFQDYSRSLLPWMTVYKNVELPIRKKVSRKESRERIEAILAAVGLAGKGHLYPWQMSGGMQQRAAIARALAYQPDLLLMDEPFAAVDAQTRIELEDLVLRIRDQFNTTIVFVTHDIDEAVYLSDRVIVLSGAPTKVTANIEVNLPLPRDQKDTKLLPRYGELRAQVFDLIQSAKSHSIVQRAEAVDFRSGGDAERLAPVPSVDL